MQSSNIYVISSPQRVRFVSNFRRFPYNNKRTVHKNLFTERWLERKMEKEREKKKKVQNICARSGQKLLTLLVCVCAFDYSHVYHGHNVRGNKRYLNSDLEVGYIKIIILSRSVYLKKNKFWKIKLYKSSIKKRNNKLHINCECDCNFSFPSDKFLPIQYI